MKPVHLGAACSTESLDAEDQAKVQAEAKYLQKVDEVLKLENETFLLKTQLQLAR